MGEDVGLSKRMAFVLRHDPGSADLELDTGGWVTLDELAAALGVTAAEIGAVVRESSKQRYAVLAGRIRAQQGHSVAVDLGLGVAVPPHELWHGTAEKSLPGIDDRGLERRSRHHVHLSADVETALQVGGRHGRPVVLRVAAGRMYDDGWAFSVTGNGVWLVDAVPPGYLSRLEPD